MDINSYTFVKGIEKILRPLALHALPTQAPRACPFSLIATITRAFHYMTLLH